MMKYAKDLGLGFESASIGELSQALATGVDPKVNRNLPTNSDLISRNVFLIHQPKKHQKLNTLYPR